MSTSTKYVTSIIEFFIPFTCVTLFQLCSISYPVLLKTANYGLRTMKIFCIYGYFSESRYIKEHRKLHKIALNTIAFLDTNVSGNNPY